MNNLTVRLAAEQFSSEYDFAMVNLAEERVYTVYRNHIDEYNGHNHYNCTRIDVTFSENRVTITSINYLHLETLQTLLDTEYSDPNMWNDIRQTLAHLGYKSRCQTN